jgi:hypothetical protein
MKNIINNTISEHSESWKTKLIVSSVFCLPLLFLLGIYLMIGLKEGNWTVSISLMNFAQNAFLIFKTFLTIFQLQLVFPGLFELSVDLQFFENLKNFM